MKLINCYIENFGRLSKFSYSFREGLNVIEEENGWGKSTLAVFIKAMFYGLPATRVSDLLENERRRYSPWQGGVYGGALSFSLGERGYRIERIFAQKETADVFKLFSLDTGLPSNDYTSRIGEEIFGIDAAGYERSTYFTQRPIDGKQNYGGIQGKLSEQEDLSDYKRAIDLLEKRRRVYQMNGNRGMIADLDRGLTEKNRTLEDARLDEESYRKLSEEIRLDTERIAGMEERRKATLLEAGRAAATRENRLLSDAARRLRDLLARSSAECREIRAGIGDPIPGTEETERMLEESRLLDLALAAHEKKRLRETAARRRRATRRKVGIAVLLAAVAAGALAYFSLYLLVPSAALLLLSLFLLLAGRKAGKDSGFAEEEAGLAERTAARRGFLAPLTPIVNDSGLPDDTTRLTVLREKLSALARAEETRAAQERDLDNFSREHSDLAPVIDTEIHDPGVLQRQAQELENAVLTAREALGEKRHRAKLLADSAERIPALEDEVNRTAQERADASSRLAAILKAEQYLEEAKNSLVTRYRDTVEGGFREYLTLLEAASGCPIGEEVSVSGAFDVSVTVGASTYEPTAFSTGYRDLISLCLRFALTDSLFRAEPPMMVLDDPLINLDDGKLGAAKQLLRSLAGRRQILYFTCSASRNPLV